MVFSDQSLQQVIHFKFQINLQLTHNIRECSLVGLLQILDTTSEKSKYGGMLSLRDN